MKLRYITSLAVALATAGIAGAADDLTKEITVEKDIVPQEREASRLNRTPSLSLPKIDMKRLRWSDTAVPAPVTNSISLLPPASYASTMTRSPYRGYLDLGYFPSMQIGASAGYRFLDTESTIVNGWLQYDGSQYKRENSEANKLTYKDHSAELGLGVSHYVGDIGTFEANIGYGFSSYNYPTLTADDFNQSVNRFNLGLGWSSALSNIDYTIKAGFGYFGFSKAYSTLLDKAAKEINGSVNADVRYYFSPSNSIGAELGVTFAKYSDGREIILTPANDESRATPSYLSDLVSRTAGVASVKPYYMYSMDAFSARLGVNVSHSWYDGGKTHVFPDVKLAITLARQFSIGLHLYGGDSQLNSLSSLFALSHYLNPSLIYTPSWQKWFGDVNVVIGPFSGATIELWGGMGKAGNWAMPALIGTDEALRGAYYGMDFKSTHYGMAFSYKYRDMASLRLSYEGAPQGIDKGYTMWSDRAKSVFNAQLTVSPISALDICLGYELRSGRAIYEVGSDSDDIFQGTYYTLHTIGNVNSLNLGATYRITPQFNVWANVENLLNSKWEAVYGIPAKGVTGLVGIGYKF